MNASIPSSTALPGDESKNTPVSGRLRCAQMTSLLLLSAGALQLNAQTAPAVKPTVAPESEEEIIELTPFEVNSEKDSGYLATETLAGTRIRTDLKDVGSAITVVTKEFMKDIGATDSSTLLQYTPNAEVAGTRSTYAGLGNGTSVEETGSLRAPAGAQRVRGLAAADNTRDFFVSDIPWDSYNVDRVDIQRGPNSILFGLGSPAGIVNASLRNPDFKNKGSFEVRTGSYGSTRTALDVNQVLIKGVLAIRADALWNNEKYRQKPAYQDDRRGYAAVRFEPKLFKAPGFNTSIKAKFENGDIKANRPRIITPNDSITPWFRPIDKTSINGGMGKTAVNNGYDSFRSDVANIVAGDGRGLEQAATVNYQPWLSGRADQQQPMWLIDGTTNQLYRVYSGYINPGARNADGTVRGSAQGLLGRRFATQFYQLGSLNSYATNAKLANAQYGQYRTQSLLDDTVFDFYNTLIDGPTKKEFEKWNSYNISLSQTGWGDRVGLEVNFDKQKYKRGGESLIGGAPTITIDILKNFQDFYLNSSANGVTSTTNPNFGRAYVPVGPGSGNSYESDRKYVRTSLFGELRATDVFERKSFLATLLGKHRFNGVYSKEDYQTENRAWQMYANSREWAGYWNGTDGSTSSITADRPPVGVVYLGSSIADRSFASGAGLPGITSNVTFQDANVYAFDSTWNNPGVAYNAAWTIPTNMGVAFDPATATSQASNPANYVGWNSNFKMNLLRYADGADQSLITNAQKSLRVTRSYAGSWQGFLWRDSIVPTLGWRFDEVKSKGVTAAVQPANRSIRNLQPDVYRLPDQFPASQIFKNHATSGGLVLHLNRVLERDVLPINVSLSYNKSNNFQVTDLRRDIYGNAVGNPTGSTKDYGVLLSTKDGKYSFRAVKYESSVANASAPLNNSGLGNTIQQGVRFRNVFLYKLSNYPWSSREQSQDRNTWAPKTVNGVLQTQAEADADRDASIRAWNDIQKTLTAKGYFAAWGYTPTTNAALTDRATYEAAKTSPSALDPAAQYLPDPNTVFAYTYTAPQGFTVTSDTQSKGYEFEFTANPTKQWRVSVNASKTEAVRTNVGGPLLDEFVTYMDKQMAGPAGDMRQFSGGYNPSNEVRQNWNNWRGNYTLLKLQENSAASEIRKWRYNVVTNYSFDSGVLKGVGVGASHRWQDKVVIGYPVIPGANSQASFDLTKPYYGPSEDGTDFWLSYERKLTDKINWRIQLNVRNAFAKDKELIPISVQPDGSTWAAVRIAPAREWFLTNTFSF